MHKSLAKLALLIILIISILATISSLRVSFDYDFEKFFPLGDQDLDFYLEYRQEFENDNDFLLLGFENKQGVFQENFLLKIDSLSNFLPEALKNKFNLFVLSSDLKTKAREI